MSAARLVIACLAFAQSSSPPTTTALADARGCGQDAACVIRALEGRARTCAEFGMLAFTYGRVGRAHDARAIYDRYLRRCGAHDRVPRGQ